MRVADAPNFFRCLNSYYVQDIYNRELEEGDFIVLTASFKEGRKVEGKTIIYLCVLTKQGLLNYDETTNCLYMLDGICDIVYKNVVYAYKLGYKLSYIDRLKDYKLFKKDSDTPMYRIENTSDFNIESVLETHKAAQVLKPGDLVLRMSSDFLERDIYNNYGLVVGENEVYSCRFHEDIPGELLSSFDYTEFAYKVLHISESEKVIKKQLIKSYQKYMKSRIMFLARKRFEPGDIILKDDAFVYLFSKMEAKRTKYICLSLNTELNKQHINWLYKILYGGMTESLYNQLLYREDIKLIQLDYDFYIKNYFTSHREGITENILSIANRRYEQCDVYNQIY